jgi:hypothetical protein
LTNYRRALVQQSLDYTSAYFEHTNQQLTGADFKLETKLLKQLVLLSRDALKRVNGCLEAPEVDVRLFIRLKKSMQEFLGLIIMHIARAGVTAKDIQSRHSADRSSLCSN